MEFPISRNVLLSIKKDNVELVRRLKTTQTVHAICDKVFDYAMSGTETWCMYKLMDEHVMRYCVSAVLAEVRARFPDSKVLPIHISTDKNTGKTTWVENPDELFSYVNGVRVDWTPLVE
jgi:hypothetical protein